jgi:hypothetical protein
VINKFKIEIVKHVDITDLGELHWILRIEVRPYINLILQYYGFEDAKPVLLPMDPSIRLSSAQSLSTSEEFARMQNVPYHEAIGSLI